jgi:DNA mismatch repair protein MutS2
MYDRYLRVLEFDKIIDQLVEHTSFSAGRELALALRPVSEAAEVRHRLQVTTEAKELLATRTEVTLGGARDVRSLARRAALGSVLQPSEFLDIRGTLLSARTLALLLARLAATLPLLAAVAADLDPLGDLIDEIGRCLDDEGRVLDSASPELARIRRDLISARERLVERLRRIVTATDNARFLQDPIVTERGGRYVIPLRLEFKGRIPGIIHDQSASGATLFIEPLETVELNNQWHELQLAEVHEIERILTALTWAVGRQADVVVRDVEVLAELDLALAKGRYSFALQGRPAELVTAAWPVAAPSETLLPSAHPLHLIHARHPLLSRDTVVPIDVYLGGNATVLVVTGPNTGGKTVALKTVGLLAAMNQAGLHIPAADGSRLPLCSGIYADIGDEQSIEQSLSTFSSHISHIVDILAHADTRALVLLDELGAGTDPVEGAALAQALINTLLARRCLTVSSTHYSEIKMFAFDTPGVQNASVEFDVETLAPTYRMVIGLPGRSNAFAIARRLGLGEEIIAAAQRLVSPEDQQADALLGQIKVANEATERARREVEERLARSVTLERELRQKLNEVEESRHQILDQAREQGRRELDQLRQELRRLRLSLLQQQKGTAPSPIPAPAFQEIAASLDRLTDEMAPLAPLVEPVAPSSQTPQVGDTVYVSTLRQAGELLSVNGNEAEVRVGGFRLRTRLSAIEFRSHPAPPGKREETVVRRTTSAVSPGMELDLRGWRAEEVAPTLDKYLDNAYLAGLPWVHIIHGKGMGVLKEVVRQFLSGHPLVSTYRLGALNEGGEGVTVVQLHRVES